MIKTSVCLLSGLLALASCGGDSDLPGDRGELVTGGEELLFNEVLCVADTGDTYIDEPGTEVIRDNQRFVERYLASNPFSQEAVPEIDFANQMVIAIHQGLQPTLGYGVDVTEIERRNDQIVVNYDVITPTQECVVEDAESSPFCFVALDRSDEEVVFEARAVTECVAGESGIAR